MAFKKPYLQTLGRFSSADLLGPQNAVWFYQSGDSVAVVKAAGYFNNARLQLTQGDIIMANCNGVLRHLVATVPADGVSNITCADMASNGGRVVVSGQQATVTAADTIATGLATVQCVVATLDDNMGDNPEWVTATIGDQAGAPAAGSFILKTWQNTAGNDPTPTAATTFAKKVNWIAIGTLA